MPDPHIVAYYERMAPALLPFLAGLAIAVAVEVKTTQRPCLRFLVNR
jgi:hypothetical protein